MPLANPHNLSFVKFETLNDVLGRYDYIKREFEAEAQVFLEEKVYKSLEMAGTRPSEITIRVDSLTLTGALDIYVLWVDNPDELGPVIERTVEGFGPVSELTVNYSSKLGAHVRPHIAQLVDSLEQFHRLFLAAFLRLHTERKQALSAGLSEILFSACNKAEECELQPNARISVTVPDSEKFQFYLNASQVEELACIVSDKKKELDMDPVDLLSGFLYSSDTDFFFKQFREGMSGFSRATFSSIESTSINKILQYVEKMLVNSDTISCIEVHEYGGHSLQITTIPEHEDLLSNVMARNRNALTSKFEDNVTNRQAESGRLNFIVRQRLNEWIASAKIQLSLEATKGVGRASLDQVIAKLLG